MGEQAVLVAADSADILQRLLIALQSAGRAQHHDGAMAVSLGDVHVQLGDVLQVRLLFAAAHLIPLEVGAVAGMEPSEGLHRQPEFQLERGHLSADGFASERADEAFSRGHVITPFIWD